MKEEQYLSRCRGGRRKSHGNRNQGVGSCKFICVVMGCDETREMVLEPLGGEKRILLASKSRDSLRRALEVWERTVR